MRADELATVSGNVFIVSDALGNITGGESQGLFAADTRYLSIYELRVDVADVVLLRSGSPSRGTSEVFATNSGKRRLPAHSLEIYRRRELSEEFYECLQLTNRGDRPLQIPFSILADVDFADIFEVRAGGANRHSRSLISAEDGKISFRDRRREQERKIVIEFDPAPASISRGRARFSASLEPGESWSLDVRGRWSIPDPETTRPIPIPLPADEDDSVLDWRAHVPALETDDLNLAIAYRQAVEDIASLEIALDSGHPIPAAGLPWYLAIFGRDSTITSIQTLMTGRRQAYGTLRTLAAYQSHEDSDFRDAEPGKMPHEVRFGELAMSGAIPHSRYYGTVDATPLWLILLRSAIRWSADLDIVDELIPAAEEALAWIDNHGDIDGDGLIEYRPRSRNGLANQGWKDSWDSIRFADGSLAKGPIALVEVQGYVYAARQSMADIYDLYGDGKRADHLRGQAEALRRQVHDSFWMPEAGYFALALDGKKRKVDSVTSNPGHLLWTGILEQPFIEPVVERLMSPELFSGWGIRTMATDMKAYNPFSYHNGSVWPHDNSLIAAGLARYRFVDEARRIIDAMIDASTFFNENRLPELFCGYDRDQTSFPIDYPVACAPQAWASGSVLLMLQTLAGITPGEDNLIVEPLPHGRELRLRGVRFRGRRFDLQCEPGNVKIERADHVPAG